MKLGELQHIARLALRKFIPLASTRSLRATRLPLVARLLHSESVLHGAHLPLSCGNLSKPSCAGYGTYIARKICRVSDIVTCRWRIARYVSALLVSTEVGRAIAIEIGRRSGAIGSCGVDIGQSP